MSSQNNQSNQLYAEEVNKLADKLISLLAKMARERLNVEEETELFNIRWWLDDNHA